MPVHSASMRAFTLVFDELWTRVNALVFAGIRVFRTARSKTWMARTRACPSCAYLSAASRIDPTCSDKPGHDAGVQCSKLNRATGANAEDMLDRCTGSI
jgi:hypothetical protein